PGDGMRACEANMFCSSLGPAARNPYARENARQLPYLKQLTRWNCSFVNSLDTCLAQTSMRSEQRGSKQQPGAICVRSAGSPAITVKFVLCALRASAAANNRSRD